MEETVTVVSGLPRSGTSAMMQMLAAGGMPILTDQIRQPDEDNPRGYYELEAVKAIHDNPDWLEEASGKAVKMVYRLLYDLPGRYQYRVIFMRRDLDEVIASQEEMLRRLGKESGEVSEAKLKDLYERQLQDVRQWLESQPNFSVLSVDYHDLLEDPSRVAANVNRFLDGRLDVDAMVQVPDRSLYRQRR